jgi:hypothetical protein
MTTCEPDAGPDLGRRSVFRKDNVTPADPAGKRGVTVICDPAM